MQNKCVERNFHHLHALEEILKGYRSGKVNPVTRIFWNLGRDVILGKLINVTSENDAVLDVGCGTGSYMIALAKMGRKCYGIDPFYDVSLLEARRKALEEKVGVSLCQGVGENLPFKGETFDTVLCISTLQHVSDQQETLREIGRVLKNKGLLLVSIPTVRNISTLFRRMKIPEHFTKGFDMEGFREILVDNGFRILEMKGYGFFPPFTPRVLRVCYGLFGENVTRVIMRLLDVFTTLWLSAASSLVALCEKKID